MSVISSQLRDTYSALVVLLEKIEQKQVPVADAIWSNVTLKLQQASELLDAFVPPVPVYMLEETGTAMLEEDGLTPMREE